MNDFQIVPLSEKPEFADVCAAWSFGEWASQYESYDLEKSINRYKETAQKKDDNLTWIAYINDKPAGMISLRAEDHSDCKDLTPWLASLYVHNWYRKQGVATQLIQRLEQEAKLIGTKTLYLFTGTADAKSLYEKLDWKDYRTCKDPADQNQNVYVMSKDLK